MSVSYSSSNLKADLTKIHQLWLYSLPVWETLNPIMKDILFGEMNAWPKADKSLSVKEMLLDSTTTEDGRSISWQTMPFKRKHIDNDAYLQNVIKYIHYNPVNHGFCQHPIEYPWSSYLTCISEKPTKLKREKVISLFGNINDLIQLHNQNEKFNDLEKYLNL